MINVLLVEDSRVFVMGLKMALRAESDIGDVYAAANVAEARAILNTHPDIKIAIVDVCLDEEMDGLKLVAEIKDKYPKVKSFVLSQYKDPYYIYKAINSGARAYIAKDSSPDVIIGTIRNVMSGSCTFFGDTITPEMLVSLFGNADNARSGKPFQLTSKELDVLQYITQGYSNSQIATALGIASNTVESYKERIKGKLGYDSIIECVAFALKKGLVLFRD